MALICRPFIRNMHCPFGLWLLQKNLLLLNNLWKLSWDWLKEVADNNEHLSWEYKNILTIFFTHIKEYSSGAQHNTTQERMKERNIFPKLKSQKIRTHACRMGSLWNVLNCWHVGLVFYKKCNNLCMNPWKLSTMRIHLRLNLVPFCNVNCMLKFVCFLNDNI
jgi:hypothetical protein